MKRRAFLTASAAVGMTPLMGMQGLTDSTMQPAAGAQQYFEWTRYELHPGKRQGMVAEYWREVAIPALNRAGIPQVGVFNVKHGPNDATLHVIVPHPTLESIVTLNDRLISDDSFVQDGSKFLKAPMSETAFVQMEKTIMRAFTGLPTMQVPTQKKEGKARIFQVRTYESPNLFAAKRKIHMFNEGKEIAIFQRSGMQPLLFGEVIAGNRMPSLVYILVFSDFEDLRVSWSKFSSDPEWRKLSADPFYAETVSRINDWIWTPTQFSQV